MKSLRRDSITDRRLTRRAIRFAWFLTFTVTGWSMTARAEDQPVQLVPSARQTVMAAQPAQTAPLPKLVVRGGVHEKFDRIVFDWPRTVSYRVVHQDTKVEIVFDAPAALDVRALRSAQLTRIRNFSGQTIDGRLHATFTVADRAVIKSFKSGKSVAFDILADSPVFAAEKKTGTDAEQPTAPSAEPSGDVSESPGAPQKAAMKEGGGASAPVMSPSPPKAVDPAPPPPEALPVPTPLAETRETDAVTDKKNATPDDVTQALPDLGDQPLPVAALDPGTPVGLALYTRGGYAYVVFDRKLGFDLDRLTVGQPAPRIKLHPLNLQQVTGYRFPLSEQIDVRAMRNGHVWQIFLAKQRRRIPVTLALKAEPDYALGPRLVLPALNAPAPIRLLDPVVGDTLFVVPLLQAGQSISLHRLATDFEILPSAQGMVVRPINEAVVVRQVPDGVEIAADGGLNLSPAEDTGARHKTGTAAAARSRLFEFDSWRGKDEETFTQTRQRLMQTIVDVPELERDRARLELARFYFAHGMARECLAMLDFLAGRLPDLVVRPEFLALRGAARIVNGMLDDGLADLAYPDLSGEQEIVLWQAFGLAKKRDWTEAMEKFSRTVQILDQYPDPFFGEIAALALESAIAAGKVREGAHWIDGWQQREDKEVLDKPMFQYLRGTIQYELDHEEAAESLWRAARAGNDRLAKIRAELAMIDFNVGRGAMSPADAAARLEGLRFAWRGDDLETDILRRLGHFYLDARKYREGLTTLGYAARLVANTPLSTEIRQEMTAAFRNVFLKPSGEVDTTSLSPIETLAIYQEFRDLMPTDQGAVTIIGALAERLASIDLLDQAAELLEMLVKTRLQGEEKAKTGARLAALRLLDRNPEAALAALDLSLTDPLPDALKEERLFLRARALSDLGRAGEAMQSLANNTAQTAKILRADIAWRAQNWREAAAIMTDLTGPPPAAGQQLTPDQILWLVNAATAYALIGDQKALDRLAIDFTAAMSGTPQKDVFMLLTRAKAGNSPRDFAEVQARIGEVDMFRNFLNKYRGP